MTAPFNWAGLWEDLETASWGEQIDILRTRIEAAFVPVETYHEATARARQEGWNAAIEAAAAHLERDDGYGEWWEAAATIRALASDGDNI